MRSHEKFHIFSTGLCRGTSCSPGSWWRCPDWELSTLIDTFSLAGLLAPDFIIDPIDHHDTPYQESCPQNEYQFKESHGIPSTTTQKLELWWQHTLGPEWQQISRFSSRSSRKLPVQVGIQKLPIQDGIQDLPIQDGLQNSLTYMACYDPQLQGCLMWP